jgi:hypothetical protein
MTDDFKALVFKTRKGKPKCLEVLCAANATSINMEVNPGVRGEKSDNNRLSTDTHWLCGIRGNFETGSPITYIVSRIQHATLKRKVSLRLIMRHDIEVYGRWKYGYRHS